jgi:flagellar biosynthesis protein FlhF
MRFESFHGTDLRRVFDETRQALGEDAIIVRSHLTRNSGHVRVEVIAARAADIERLRERLTVDPPQLQKSIGGRGRFGPYVVALVGPTGAGKTTTAAKLALHPDAFGQKRVGLLTLDTFRVGAIEQMQAFAEIAELRLEVVYDEREAIGALKRLDDCDVVIVDTPGRGPRSSDDSARWQAVMKPLSPDEVHLVVPATIRTDIATALRDAYAACAPTHVIISKVDEAPEDGGLAALAAALDLPSRWMTDGQAIPDDLRSARRILSTLGSGPSSSARAIAA